jgi:hypothetical protein
VPGSYLSGEGTLRLESARVTHYRSIEDFGELTIELDVTVGDV